jgi:hypothetical protein
MNNNLFKNNVKGCIQHIKTEGGVGLPGQASVKYEYKKEDCGKPECRDSGVYDGRHDERDDSRSGCNIQ